MLTPCTELQVYKQNAADKQKQADIIEKAEYFAREKAIIQDRSQILAPYIDDYINERLIYIISIGRDKVKEKNDEELELFSFGMTATFTGSQGRYTQHQRTYPTCVAVALLKCTNYGKIEKLFKAEAYDIRITYNGDTEVVFSTPKFGISNIIKMVQNIIALHPDTKPAEIELLNLRHEIAQMKAETIMKQKDTELEKLKRESEIELLKKDLETELKLKDMELKMMYERLQPII